MSLCESVQCGCGRVQSPAEMTACGWQETGNSGEWALLANCVACHSTHAIQVVHDASKCQACRQLVTGESDAVKSCRCAADIAEAPRVLCAGCNRREEKELQAVRWAGWARRIKAQMREARL